MTVPMEPLTSLDGERITVRGKPASEAMLVNKDKGLYAQLFEIEEARDSRDKMIALSSIRMIGATKMSADMKYVVEMTIPHFSAMNPGYRHQNAWGYSLAVAEIGDAGRGIFRKARTRLNRHFMDAFSAQTGSFLMSQITGDRSQLSREVRQAFNATGLAHVLSISGTHFGLLFVILFRLIRAAIRCLPLSLLTRLTNYVTPSQIAALVCLPVIACYLGISDMSTPAVRSFLMITLFLVGLLLHRSGMWLNTLLFAATVILLLDPGALLDLSFQLSFIAVLCIGLVSEQWRETIEGRERTEHEGRKNPELKTRVIRFAGLTSLISLAAGFGTAPLVAYYFHYFSVISPLTNLLITPVIGFIILPVSLIASFVFLVFGVFPFQSFVEFVVTGILMGILEIARFPLTDMAIPSFPSILLVIFYSILFSAVIGLIGISSRRERSGGAEHQIAPIRTLSGLKQEDNKGHGIRQGFLTACLLGAMTPFLVYALIRLSADPTIRVTYLDVGQADAAVVELPDGRVIVVDTGKSGVQVSDFLRYIGVRKIDALVISHADVDHAGGVRFLIENFTVTEVWDNGRLTYSFPYEGALLFRHLERGDVVHGEGYRIVCLHPYGGYYAGGRRGSSFNDESLVLKMEGLNLSFLFTGDVEKEAQENLVHLGGRLRSAVFKVPHHGGLTSLSPDFLRHVSPEISIISVGRGNRYGMPHREILDILSETDLYRTDKDGAVGITKTTHGSPRIVTARELDFERTASPAHEWNNIMRLFRTW